MLNELQIHINNNLPFLKESKLLIAISGGLDSVVLTHLCHQLILNITLAHCNFNLRGNESDADENFVLQLTEDLELEIFTEHFDTEVYAKENKLSIQMAARELRYNWFEELAEQLQFDYILTAHHADDNLETFLINLTRGTGLDGLTGIPVINNKLVRPILPFPREQLETYAKANNIKWREDSSNASTKYLRNKLRHDVIPVLKETNSQLLQNFNNTLEHLKDSKAIIDDRMDSVSKTIINQKDEHSLAFNVSEIKTLNNPKAYLFEILKSYNFTEWDDVTNLLEAQSGKQVFSPTHRLINDRTHLLLSEIQTESNSKVRINIDNQNQNTPLGTLSFDDVDELGEASKSIIFVDKDKLKLPLELRQWETGDYFYPLGMNGKKKLSKYFKDEKLSLLDKENVRLLCSGEDIVWVISKRADDRFKVTKNTKNILKIECYTELVEVSQINMKLQGQIVDIQNKRIYKGEITVNNGKITSIAEKEHDVNYYILPGFVDAHIHIESSMLIPSEFARIAVTHGTVATVSDPHEIANVLGVKGVDFMIENGKKVPFKFNFGAPSCVPATSFESAGAIINSDDIKTLLENPDIKYLAEMMNYPGVLFDEDEVMKKIAWAKHYNKPVDGHAPGIVGDDISKYINSGISTDHECFTFEEGLEKLQKGMKILIREGSAAKNFEALIGLLPEHYESMMFCSDDKHPDDLIVNHINKLCARAICKNMDVFKVLQAACINPVKHYNLDVGLLQVGDFADCIVVEDLKDFKTIQTYINGELVYNKGESLIEPVPFEILNNFNCDKKEVSDFRIASSAKKIRVIEALEGQLVTNELIENTKTENGNLISNIETDVLKMTVVNRYKNEKPAMAFIKNFGLKEGAIASSVGHDSHNIIAVGVSDEAICKAVNLLIENKGGICAVSNSEAHIVPLPVAGIMSDKDGETIGKQYAELDKIAKQFGSKLNAPYMTLSFMALLVIPSLKLSDKGLFNGTDFKLTSLEIN